MKGDNTQHKEAQITAGFIDWFKKEKGYIEYYEDSDTSGSAPFDSIGIINGELYLIEFKSRIYKSTVLYKNSKGSSIEKKIAQALNLLYKQVSSNIYNSIREYYTDSTIPSLIIVAEHISVNALVLMSKMLEERSQEWQFNYTVIQWANEKANYLLYKKHDFQFEISNAQIYIPDFQSTSPKRSSKLTNQIVREMLAEVDKLAEYELFLGYAKSIGLSLTYNINNINFSLNGKALFGIWPLNSDTKNGLRMTFEIGKIHKLLNSNISLLEDLGIERSEKKLGYLGYNGYVKSQKEMKSLIERLENSFL